jgi:hypothetical protein
MTSAKESNSTPMGLGALSKRADMPSKKSKKAPQMIHINAHVNSPCEARKIAILPQSKLQQVNEFGTIRLIFMA